MNKTVKIGLAIGVLGGMSFALYIYLRNKRLQAQMPSVPETSTPLPLEDGTFTELQLTDLEGFPIKGGGATTPTTTTTTTTTTPIRTGGGGGGGMTEPISRMNMDTMWISKHYSDLQKEQVPFYQTSLQTSGIYSSTFNPTRQTTLESY